jgi:hypothetical protein
MKNNDYNRVMNDRFEEFVLSGKQWSGQQISELIEDVYDDYNYYLKTRESPEITLYYRDLLAYLVKNYGH